MHSECSKVSYYQPKNQHFFDNKSITQILCHIFLQDQSRCALWHKNKYIHILQGVSGRGWGGGGKSPKKPKKCKKNEGFKLQIYLLMMSIQIHARGSGFFFYQNSAIRRILCVPKYVIINLKINNFKANFIQ